MDHPVSATDGGIKLQPERMEKERLYHCIFQDKVMLVFKDSKDVLNCYEVDDAELVDQIKKCSDDEDLTIFFEDYLLKMNGAPPEHESTFKGL